MADNPFMQLTIDPVYLPGDDDACAVMGLDAKGCCILVQLTEHGKARFGMNATFAARRICNWHETNRLRNLEFHDLRN